MSQDFTVVVWTTTTIEMRTVDPALACGWLVELGCDPALAASLTSGGGEPGEGDDRIVAAHQVSHFRS